MTAFTEIEKNVMNLPPDERVVLAQRLLNSLEGFADSEIEKAWLDEANRRWKEIEEGKVQCISAEKVMEMARAAFS